MLCVLYWVVLWLLLFEQIPSWFMKLSPPEMQNLDGACIQSVNLVIDEDSRTEITLSHVGEVFMAGQYRISLPYSDGNLLTFYHILASWRNWVTALLLSRTFYQNSTTVCHTNCLPSEHCFLFTTMSASLCWSRQQPFMCFVLRIIWYDIPLGSENNNNLYFVTNR